jgi:hypothetical protein
VIEARSARVTAEANGPPSIYLPIGSSIMARKMEATLKRLRLRRRRGLTQQALAVKAGVSLGPVAPGGRHARPAAEHVAEVGAGPRRAGGGVAGVDTTRIERNAASKATPATTSAVTHRLGRLWRHVIVTPVTTALILAGCAASGVLDVSWTAPSTNTDGSPAKDVVSYRVYYSPTDAPCKRGSAGVAVAAAPKGPLPPDQQFVLRLTGLTIGKLYFVAVSAVSSRGNESDCTSTASSRARQP